MSTNLEIESFEAGFRGRGIAYHATGVQLAVSLRPRLEFYPGDVLHQLVRIRCRFQKKRCMLMQKNSVPNFILAFIPAEINSDTLNTMTAFAVCVVPLTPLDTINSQMALSRLVVSFPTFSCTSFHTRSWVNIKVLEFDL